MSFLSQLYRYRQREQRSPLEDYLTEALAEWLRLATAAGELPAILSQLFKLDTVARAPLEDLRAVRWETQHVIGHGHDSATGKRPDLVGRGPGIFIIIENKTWAPFTVHLDQDGLACADQLTLYQRYLDKRRETTKGIALLTYATLPPENWKGSCCYWKDVARYLAQTHKPKNGTALTFMAENLLTFIKDQNMRGTRINLADIVAMPAYDRLQEGMSKLGALGDKALSESLRCAGNAAPAVFQLKKPTGPLAAPSFFGAALTPGAHLTSNSDALLLCGVIARQAYELQPLHAGLPDMVVGLFIWKYEGGLEPEQQSLLEAFVTALNDRLGACAWQLTLHERDAYGPLIEVSSRLSLMDVHHLARGDDWDDIASDFFHQRCAAMLAVLASAPGDGTSTMEKALHAITGAAV